MLDTALVFFHHDAANIFPSPSSEKTISRRHEFCLSCLGTDQDWLDSRKTTPSQNAQACSLLLELVSVSYNEHESLMQQSNNELWFWKRPWMSPAFAVFTSFLVAHP